MHIQYAPNLEWLFAPRIPFLGLLVAIVLAAAATFAVSVALTTPRTTDTPQVATVADLPGEVSVALWENVGALARQEPAQELPTSLEAMLAANWPAKKLDDKTYVVLVPYENRLASQLEYTVFKEDGVWRPGLMLNEEGKYKASNF